MASRWKKYYLLLVLFRKNPSESLNPVRKIGKQMQDVLDVHQMADSDNSYKKQCLRLFGLQEAERVLAAYPHELSGGMLQRVLCAMAVSSKPEWILADEPTKGLDEQVGAVACKNLLTIKQDLHLSMLIITHDIAFNFKRCVMMYRVMYAGQVLEHNADIGTNRCIRILKDFCRLYPRTAYRLFPARLLFREKVCRMVVAERCPTVQRVAREEKPAMQQVGNAEVRCFLYAEG